MTSSEDQQDHEEEYLVDFLYLDRPRIASYYAQLFDHGIHTSTKTVSGTNSTSSDKAALGIPKLLGGEVAFSDAVQSSVERQYDAAWHVPLDLLGELNEKGYINESIRNARLGEIVLFRGNLQLIDLRMIQRMWEPIMELHNAGAQANTHAQKKAKKATDVSQKHMVKIIENLPHTLQLRAFNDDDQAWSTLTPENLTVNPTDLAFKHGISIPGEWTIIALLDAKPNDRAEEPKLPIGLSELESGMLQMMLHLQVFLGRQGSDFGITPIAIYRSVAK